MTAPRPLACRSADPVLVFMVRVGWTSTRPVRPDEHVRHVLVASADGTGVDARLAACQMVACDPRCEMPTSAAIIDVYA